MERERGGETQRKAEDRERKSKRVRCVTGKLNQEIGQDDRGRWKAYKQGAIASYILILLHTNALISHHKVKKTV